MDYQRLERKKWLYPAGCCSVRSSISHGRGTLVGFSDGNPGGDHGLSPQKTEQGDNHQSHQYRNRQGWLFVRLKRGCLY